jgi:CubicO group peptidase (beta-lactamase class C family)
MMAALLAAIGLLPLPHESSAGTQVEPPVLSDDFSALARRLMARDQIPGLAVGVVERGHLVFARGFGYRDVERHLPVTPNTLFALGSCSKAFTAAAIALLADEGRVSLDAPVRTYLGDFSLKDPVASATVTTRDILTHQSGLPRHDLFWYEAPFSREELYHRIRFLEPSGPPHTQWRYNSLMYVVAGRIVESVSGESWERFVQARILSPLEMNRTVLSAERMETDPDHASPYALHEGRLRKIAMLRRLSAIAPAGAVHANVQDLARWLTFQAERSPPLLREAIWRELHRPEAPMPAPAEPEVQHPSYALGWIHENYRGHPLVLHNGAIDGFTVHLGFLPETGQGLILLMNRDLAPAALMALAYSAYDRLLRLAPLDWPRRLEETPTPAEVVREAALDFPLETVVGEYEHPAYGALTVRAEADKLVIVFRTLRFTLAYQGKRRFRSLTPVVDGAPQISVEFSDANQKSGEPLELFIPLNFDDGDPVEAFIRTRPSQPVFIDR